MASTEEDGLYCNLISKQEVDLDDQYNIQLIQQIVYDLDDRCFYIVANKKDEKLGLYLIKFSQDNPADYSFILEWTNRLDVDDVDVYLIRNEEKNTKELVVSYKSIYINTQNVVIIDVVKPQTQSSTNVIFVHESF